MRLLTVSVLLSLVTLAGCAVNPVTGKNEIMLIGEQKEMAIGREQYKPAQQSQGGPYTLDPELTIYVRDVGNKLARVSDRPDLPYEFVVLNNSVPNAWALPSGKIAVNRGLLIELQDEAQLAAVIGHEIVHAAAKHSAKRMQSGMVLSAGMAGLGIALNDTDYGKILMGGAALGAGLALAKYGREDELESDEYGMQYMVRAGYDPKAAVDLQEIFVRLSKNRQSSWVNGLFASHPPSQERVEKNRLTAQRLGGAATYRGKKAFMQATARIQRTKPAYEAYAEGLQLFSKKDNQGALNKVNKALKIEPKEAQFYALRGDIYEKLGDKKRALKDYDKAVVLNPDLFSNHLRRGLANMGQGKYSVARKDLQQSNKLLPTAIAYLKLGDIEAKNANLQQAYKHYSVAAQAQGEIGQEARNKAAEISQGQTGQ